MSSGWFVQNKIESILPENVEGKTILDVGFGYGYNGFNIRMKKKGIPKLLDGIDLFKLYCDRMNKLKIYDYIINNDILYYPLDKYDIIICAEVLEHIEKDKSMMLIDRLISLTNELLIITTPLNFFITKEVNGNKNNLHRCKVRVDEFKSKGFKVEILHLINGSPKERFLYYLYCRLRGKTIKDSIIAVKYIR